MALVLFDQRISGPPPGNATTGTEQWIDLGLIPVGSKIWIGSVTYASPGKSLSFELRTNTAGKSAATTAATLLLSTVAMTPKAGTKTTDLYRNGRMYVATVVGTGVERWWLRLVSKSGTQTEYLFAINHTLA